MVLVAGLVFFASHCDGFLLRGVVGSLTGVRDFVTGTSWKGRGGYPSFPSLRSSFSGGVDWCYTVASGLVGLTFMASIIFLV